MREHQDGKRICAAAKCNDLDPVHSAVLPDLGAGFPIADREHRAVSTADGGGGSDVRWIKSGQFAIDLAVSVYRVVVGFVLGASVGVIFGILTGQFQLFSSLFSPIFHILRPIPPIAFVPIVILWFGLSEAGKIFLVFWGVFFTVWLTTHIGVQKIDRGLIRAALMLGTPKRRMLSEVVLLGALPYIAVGLRNAVSISFYTLVAAELAGSFAGIVYRIEIAQQNLQTGQVMGGLVALGAVSFMADRGFAVVTQRLVWWR